MASNSSFSYLSLGLLELQACARSQLCNIIKFYIVVLRQDFTLWPELAWHSLCSSGWPKPVTVLVTPPPECYRDFFDPGPFWNPAVYTLTSQEEKSQTLSFG